jgi:hypothetical protein
MRHIATKRYPVVIEKHAIADEQSDARPHAGAVEGARQAEFEQRLRLEAEESHVALRIKVGVDDPALIVRVARREIDAPQRLVQH